MMMRQPLGHIIVLFVSASSLGLSGCVSEYGFSSSDLVNAGSTLDGGTPSPTPSPDPSGSPTPGPSASPTPDPTVTPSPTSSPTPSPTATPSPTPSVTPDPTSTPSPTGTPTPDPTSTPTPSPTVSPTPSPSPSVTPSPTPTVTPTPTSTPSPSPTPTANSQTDSFNAPAINTRVKVDVLFVVDNSGSMDAEQATLAASMNSFISTFVTRDVDFHLGMVTTDVTASGGTYWDPNRSNSPWAGYVQPDRARLLSKSTSRYLENSTPNLVNQFMTNLRPGTRGSGAEQGLQSLYHFLDSGMQADFNQGFIREDALLAVIFVTDEDEDISNGETIQQRITRVVDRVKSVKGPNSRGYRFDFVINLDAPVTNNVYPSGTLPYPKVYIEMANQTASRKLNVMSNFGPAIATIGEEIVEQAEKEFRLTRTPTSALTVRIDGALIAYSSSDGYTFHADRNTIELHGAALSRSPGSVVTVRYEW